MQEIKISFIIPVYNVEQYIPECIDSILKQNIDNIEIILVNDGSTDNSLLICRQYEEKYECVYVIDKENEGVSVARNVGMKNCTGKYICFVDADDFYILDFAKEFFEICIKYDLDIIRGIYCTYEEKTGLFNHINRKELSYFNQCINGFEFLEKSLDEDANEVVPWLGFFKRSFLENNGIRFPPGIAFEEDQLFFLKALLTENCKVMQVNKEFYAYRVRMGSVTKTPSINNAYDVGNVVEKELELIRSLDLDIQIKNYALRYVSASFYQLTSIYGRVDKNKRKEIRHICSRNVQKICAKYPANRHQSTKIKMFVYAPILVDVAYKIKFFKMKGNGREV